MYDLIIFLILMSLGYGFDRVAEKRHYKSILERETVLNRIPAIVLRLPPPSLKPQNTELVMGSVVISIDYFKRIAAGLRSLVGANMVFNIKMETASISKGRKNKISSVEVLVYGTAIWLPRYPVAPASNIFFMLKPSETQRLNKGVEQLARSQSAPFVGEPHCCPVNRTAVVSYIQTFIVLSQICNIQPVK